MILNDFFYNNNDVFFIKDCLGYFFCKKNDFIKVGDHIVYFLEVKEIEFDDKFIYDEIKREISERKIPLKRILKDEAIKAFNLWAQTENKTKY